MGQLAINTCRAAPWIVWFLLQGSEFVHAGSSVSGPSLAVSKSPITEQLSQKTVQGIFRDSSGFLWLVSQQGIHRSDGKRLVSYGASAERRIHQLVHDDVRDIIQTSDGKIWLATNGGGLLRYDNRLSVFQRVEEVSNFGESFTAIFKDRDGLIWLGTLGGEVAVFNPSTGILTPAKDSNVFNSGNGFISVFAQDQTGRLYIGTEKRGVIAYKFGKSTTPFLKNIPKQPLGKISTIEIDNKNQVWVGTEKAGALRVSPEGKVLAHFMNDLDDPSSLSSNTVNHILQDTYGRFWISTDIGVNILLEGKKKFLRLNKNNSNLMDDLVLHIYQDRENTFWVGTNFGLYKVIDSQFALHQDNFSGRSSAITSFAETSDGLLWVSGYQDIFIFDRANLSLMKQNDQLPLLDVHKYGIMALESTAGFLWIGYRSNGLARVNLETLSTSLYNSALDNNPAFLSDSISAIEKYESNNVRISTYGGGIIQFENSSGEFRSITHNKRHEISDRIISLLITKQGETYLGTVSGISMLPKGALQLVPVEISGSSEHLNRSVITAILEDQAQNLWIGTQYDGLYLWTASSRMQGKVELQHAEKSRKLPSSSIYAIEEDQNGYLWISTANGLLRMDPKTFNFVTFDHRDGLQDNEFNIGASFKDSEGYLYFGGERGFNRFDPSKIVVDTTPPKVVLTSTNFADTSLDYDESYLPPAFIHLNHRDTFATFSFSALEFREHAQIKYRYKLENYGSEWIDLGNQHSLTLSNLPSGVYMLKVRASGADGVWSDKGLDIELYVHAPPWLDWYAFSLYSAFVFGMGIFIRKYYDTYALMENANRMALRMEITAEQTLDNLEEQLSLDQKLSGNIHQHIGDLLGFLGDSFQQQGEASDSPAFREQLLHNQQRIMCLQHLEKNLHFLGDRVVIELQAFATELSQALCSEYSSLELTVVPVVEVLDIKLDAKTALPAGLILGELLRNSLQHAFIGASGVQTVSVSFNESDDHKYWILEAGDSGAGIPDNIDPQRPITGGLDLVRQCAEALQARYELERTGGTVFRFYIPRTGQ